ncbi:MAG: DinB family protein [Bacteroidetes bacterium]|nr:DinB family protein [Bacteroidota bacterium]
MSQLIASCSTILDQLADAVNQLTDIQYVAPSKILSGSTVGQHVRHTLEFFVCLEQGLLKGVVDYDKRAHDRFIEQDRKIALTVIERIQTFVNKQTTDLPVQLNACYDLNSDENISIATNYFRELVYNIEHAIHHMAIIKIGIGEVAGQVLLAKDFGVAASTIRYREESPAQVL